MKNGLKNIALLTTGVVLGASLFSGAAAYAASGLIAERSNQPIYVDGQKVELEAYNIAGANYVKLREVGKAVGFNVSYDAATNTVQIDSTAPYADEAPTQASRVVTLPTDGSKYVPKVGDLIPCDDGTVYEVKDVSRWENNVYMDGPMPDMPTPTCDWSLFPTLTLPKVEVWMFPTWLLTPRLCAAMAQFPSQTLVSSKWPAPLASTALPVP